jgi:hypothetical protein
MKSTVEASVAWSRGVSSKLSRQMFQISPVVTGTLTDFFTRLISSIRSSTFCSPR